MEVRLRLLDVSWISEQTYFVPLLIVWFITYAQVPYSDSYLVYICFGIMYISISSIILRFFHDYDAFRQWLVVNSRS